MANVQLKCITTKLEVTADGLASNVAAGTAGGVIGKGFISIVRSSARRICTT